MQHHHVVDPEQARVSKMVREGGRNAPCPPTREASGCSGGNPHDWPPGKKPSGGSAGGDAVDVLRTVTPHVVAVGVHAHRQVEPERLAPPPQVGGDRAELLLRHPLHVSVVRLGARRDICEPHGARRAASSRATIASSRRTAPPASAEPGVVGDIGVAHGPGPELGHTSGGAVRQPLDENLEHAPLDRCDPRVGNTVVARARPAPSACPGCSAAPRPSATSAGPEFVRGRGRARSRIDGSPGRTGWARRARGGTLRAVAMMRRSPRRGRPTSGDVGEIAEVAGAHAAKGTAARTRNDTVPQGRRGDQQARARARRPRAPRTRTRRRRRTPRVGPRRTASASGSGSWRAEVVRLPSRVVAATGRSPTPRAPSQCRPSSSVTRQSAIESSKPPAAGAPGAGCASYDDRLRARGSSPWPATATPPRWAARPRGGRSGGRARARTAMRASGDASCQTPSMPE